MKKKKDPSSELEDCIEALRAAPPEVQSHARWLLETLPKLLAREERLRAVGASVERPWYKISTYLRLGVGREIRKERNSDIVARESHVTYGYSYDTALQLLEEIWRFLSDEDGSLISRLDKAKKQRWYSASEARAILEELCLNGCGQARINSANFCGDRCQKSLYAWLAKQKNRSQKMKDKCTRRRVVRTYKIMHPN